ncbi:MAG: DMT family transporter [Aminipila sp.]
MNIFERNVKKVVILAVVAAAFSSIFVKLTSAPPMAIGFYRLTFALPIFAVMTLTKYKAEVMSLTKKQLAGCAIAGVFLACHFFSWFTGVGHTSVASATVLAMTDPFMILIISVFIFKEKTNKKAVAGVIVAFIGSVIISGSDYSISADVLFGDIMCLFAALFIGLYFIAGNKFRKGMNAAVYVFFVFFFCWITFTIGMLVTGTPFTGYSANDMFWIFVMAMVCQIGAHAVFNWCLGYTSALYVATCENLETFIATGLAVVLFAEIPSLWQIIGGLTIVVGVMYYNRHEGDSNGV